jgi:hypothetical protein
MLDKQFGCETGNCYKPDGTGASFSSSGFDLSHFENKTNQTEIQTFKLFMTFYIQLIEQVILMRGKQV